MLAASLAKVKELDSDPEAIVAEYGLNLQQLQFEQHQLESYTVLELSKMEIEPVKWFIPGFLPSGLTILAGPLKYSVNRSSAGIWHSPSRLEASHSQVSSSQRHITSLTCLSKTLQHFYKIGSH